MRTFSLDMIPGGAQTAVACNQFESGDVWVFALYYDGGRYEIPTGADVSITGTKPDGAAYKIAGTVVSNAVQIVVTDQITACAGRSIAEILVESETDGTTLYSANFPLLVEPAAVQGEFSPSEIPSAIVDTDGNVYYSAEYIPEVSGGVPTEVRQAMKTLFEKAAYIETGLADEVAVITAWATEATSITLDKTSITISGAGTSQITAVTVPYGSPVIWSTSDPTVATVSNAGLVTGVGNGSCTITATSGEVSATCSVAVGDFIMYDITNVLTDCTNSNVATSIAEGNSYSGTLTLPIDHSFDSVVITMGGVDITSSVYFGGAISIPQVTGDVVITATASLNYVLYDWARGKAQGSNYVINTGIIFNPALSAYDVTFSYMMETDQTSTSGTNVLGCRSASSPTGANNAFNIIMDTSTFAYHVLGVDSTPHISYTKNVLHEVEWHYNDTNPSGFVFDDVEYAVATLAKSSIVQSTKSLCLLGTNKNGTIENGPLAPYIKLGEVKISNPETDALLYDFVPAISKENGDNGFYDMINHVFYGKSTSYVECGNWT